MAGRLSSLRGLSSGQGLRRGLARAVCLLVVVVVVFGGSAVARALSPRERQEQGYVEQAVLKGISSPACTQVRVPATVDGPAPASLRSILGVLRRPATAADNPPRRVLGGQPELYVDSVRFAQAAAGERWYVWVAGTNLRPPANVDRCLAAQTADFHAELPTIPDGLRAHTSQLFATQLSTERRTDAAPTRSVGVWLFGVGAQGGSGGGGGYASLIESQGMWSSQSGGTGADPGRTLFAGVVPDGVATVTLHYPAGKLGGFSRRSGPALTVTVPAINDVVVVSVERAGNQATQAVTTTWRAADGKIIRTIHGNL